MSKTKTKPGRKEKLYLRPGYSFVRPGTRDVITAETGFEVDADDPRVAEQPHKFATEAEARDGGFFREVEAPEVTKDSAPTRPDPLKGF